MSSNDVPLVPVCASCGKSSLESISCTKCLQISCSACFSDLVSAAMVTAKMDIALLTARICRKCNDNAVQVATAAREQAVVVDHANSIGSAAADQGLCRLHGKKLQLYCVNCSVGICSGCIELGQLHDFHRVDNLAAVYLEQASAVESKRIRTEKKLNDEMHAGAAVYRRNLELIEKEEHSALQEIDAIAEKSKLEVTRITTARKEFLKRKLMKPTRNDTVLEDLSNKAKQLSPYGLLEQLPEFEKKYDGLLAQHNDITLQQVDDIHCDLIPEYQFTKIAFNGFREAASNSIVVFSLKTAYDIEWKFTVRKTNMVQIEPRTDDPEIQKLKHSVVVVISHQDYSKMIHQSFEFEGPNNVFDVVGVSHLVEQRFCSNIYGDLAINIGIRCLNTVIERQLLRYRYKRFKIEMPNVIAGTHVMDFHPKLYELKIGVELQSYQIKDDQNRLWVLAVKLVSGFVDARVYLMDGSKTRCEIFIELKHSYPRKTIINRSSLSYEFDPTACRHGGWDKFINFDTLKNEHGFHPCGKLHFRFGVRPLPDLIKPLSFMSFSSAAANT